MARGDGRPKVCYSCRKLIGTERVCPYCGADNGGLAAKLGRRAAASSSPQGAGGLSVTSALIVLDVVLFVAVLVVGGSGGAGAVEVVSSDFGVLQQLGMLTPWSMAEGQWWHLVTANFLHGGLLHVAFNSYILWQAGRILERDIGSRAFFLVYMATGIAAFAFSAYSSPTFTVGASGAVAGVLGATIARRRMVDGDFRHPYTQAIIRLVVLNAVFGLVVSVVNNAAHLGGFLAGLALGAGVTKAETTRAGRRAITVAAALFAAVTATGIGLQANAVATGRSGSVQQAMVDSDVLDCWQRQAIPAINGEQMQGLADAMACLRAVPPLNDAFDASIAEGVAALQDIRAGLEARDPARVVGGTARFEAAFNAFVAEGDRLGLLSRSAM